MPHIFVSGHTVNNYFFDKQSASSSKFAKMYSDEESQEEDVYVNYKLKYRELKKHLRALIYENECFQDELRKAQRNFLSINREKTYLLDRILRYEKPTGFSSDSEITESSEDEDSRLAQLTPVPTPVPPRKKITKRKRSEADLHNGASNQSSDSLHGFIPAKVAKSASKPSSSRQSSARGKTRKPAAGRKAPAKKALLDSSSNALLTPRPFNPLLERPASHQQEQLHMGRITDFDGTHKFEFASDAKMSRQDIEDIERRLEARHYVPKLELNTTETVPAELFSHDAEHDSEVEDNEICDFAPIDEDGTSADMILE